MTEDSATRTPGPSEGTGVSTSSEKTDASGPLKGGTEAPAMTAEYPPPSPEITVNGTSHEPTTASSGISPPSRGGVRSTSSKFANLRAAFEHQGAADGATDGAKKTAHKQ